MVGLGLDERARAVWAKSDPYHPLWCHLLDAGAVCEQLIGCLGVQNELPPTWTVFLVALHDVGKADPRFQVRNEERAEALKLLELDLPSHTDKFRHEATSGEFVWQHLSSALGWGRHATPVAQAAAYGHHGNFNARFSRDESRQSDVWERIRTQLAEMVVDVLCLGDQQFSPSGFLDYSSTGVKLTGLTVLSDWIASNEELFRFPDLDKDAEPCDYWRQAREEAARAVRSLQLGGVRQRIGSGADVT